MTETPVFTKDDLINFQPKHEFFVGVDSDGCVFDTMDLKQKTCFHPRIISHWHLEPIAKELRQAAEFVNLYSKTRGSNRYNSLALTFDWLKARKDAVDFGVTLPEFPALHEMIDSGATLSNDSMAQAAKETGNPEFTDLLKWSQDVNADVTAKISHVPPFRYARECLDKMIDRADMICVSATPFEALVHEWQDNDLMKYVSIIAGQELGKKTEHLTLAAKDRYAPDKILMMGDSPGDLKAAQSVGALFYPINPGAEEQSWQRFYEEACEKFFSGEYHGAYQDQMVSEFEKLLPDTPPWL